MNTNDEKEIDWSTKVSILFYFILFEIIYSSLLKKAFKFFLKFFTINQSLQLYLNSN